MTAVDLPLATVRQRAAALPFAVEDVIAEPLSAVHVVLGPEIAPRRHLAAIVSHETMRRFVASVEDREGPPCRIVPDAFALPVPPDGSWAVARDGGRVVVRRADGTGFAIETGLFALAWRADGQPALVSYGDALPEGLLAVAAVLSPDAIDANLNAAGLDLRQGIYAPRAGAVASWAKWAAGIAAAGAIAHALIAGIDLLALHSIIETRETEARTLIQAIAPATPADGDVVDLFNRLQPAGVGTTGPRFLPLMAATASALQRFAGQISVQSLAFSASDGSLGLTIEGPDLAALQAVEQALREAGLEPVSGPATTDRGAAEFRVTVRAGVAP